MNETGRPTDRADRHSDLTPDDELVTGEAVALDVRPASVILRAAGSIIDTIAYLALYLLIMLALVMTVAGDTDSALTQAISIAALVFAVLIVPVLVETLTHGRSLGKLAIGARIVRDDGGAISLRHAFIRALTGVLAGAVSLIRVPGTPGLKVLRMNTGTLRENTGTRVCGWMTLAPKYASSKASW